MLRLKVGAYSRGGASGLHTLVRDANGWRLDGVYQGARDASFGAQSAKFGQFYLVDEQHNGTLGVFREVDGQCERLALELTRGAAPCHVALSRCERWAAVANYGSGSVALFQLAPEDGLPMGPAAVLEHQGRGPDPERQNGPHAHCTAFAPDGRWLYHTDLGADLVLATRFDPDRGPFETAPVFEARPGSGPRHLLLIPDQPLALLLCELASTLTLLRRNGGAFEAIQTLSTLPVDFEGESLGGHLTINAAADRIYVSNRGHDSIAVFDLNAGGELKLRQHIASGGASPRHCLLIEAQRLLLVAHERDGRITAFSVDEEGGLSTLGQVAEVPGAAFLLREQE